MAKFKMKNGKGVVVEMESIHDADTFRQNPEWEEVFDSEPVEVTKRDYKKKLKEA